jgi:hypothetical protein
MNNTNFIVPLIIANRTNPGEGITFGHNQREKLFNHFNCTSRPIITPRKPCMIIWVKFNGRKQRVNVTIPNDIYCSRREWMDCFDFNIPFEKSGLYFVEITGIEFNDVKIYSKEHNLKTSDPTEWEAFSKLVRGQDYRGKYFKAHNLNPDDHDKYHVDHIKSVIECFQDGFTVEQTNDITNLQLLTINENLRKGRRSFLHSLHMSSRKIIKRLF